MSIERSIEEAIATGRLRAFVPEFDSDEAVRSVLLHPRLADDISGRVEAWGRRIGRLQGDWSLVKGEHVTPSMTSFEHGNAFPARCR